MTTDSSAPTAAVLIIGNEILSGRTQDTNLNYIATKLSARGIRLAEARVVADIEDEIVASVRALSARYSYVFTTGGIGPTHDDITADCVAKAFGVAIEEDPRIIEMMLQRYPTAELTPARRRMARIPRGAVLVDNPVSKLPGFKIGNVIVMAGVPAVMQAMLDHAATMIRSGSPMRVETIQADAIPEGRYGDALAEVAKARAHVIIGSYPSFADGKFKNQIVVRGKDMAEVAEARAAVEAMLAAIRIDKPPA